MKMQQDQGNENDQQDLDEDDKENTNNKPLRELRKDVVYPKIKKEDLLKVVEKLKDSLIKNNVTYYEVDSKLINRDLRKKGYVAFFELVTILQANPFSVSKENTEPLARYLVEHTPGDKVVFDEDLQVKVGIVQNAFKNLIGEYEISKTNLDETHDNIQDKQNEEKNKLIK